MAPGVYDIPSARDRRFVSVVTNTTPVGAYRGAGRPEATAAIERAIDLFAAEIGHGPGRGAPAQPAAGLHRAAARAWAARSTTAATTRPRSRRVLDAADYAGLRARAGRPPRARRRPRSSASGCRCYVEITGGGAESGAPHENATVEVHPDGIGDHPHRHLAARAGPRRRSGRCWPATSSASRSTRSPCKWGDTDLVPEGGGTGGSRSLQQGGAAVRQAAAGAGRAGQAAAPPSELEVDAGRPGGRPRPSPGCAVRRRPRRRRQLRRSSPPSTSGCSCAACSARPGATYPFGAHVAVVEVDTETGQGRAARARRRSTTPARSSTRCSPRASGTAASPRARRRRCSRRCSTTTTATRRPRPSPTTRSCPRPSCRASSWSTWRRRRRYNPLGAKGIGEAGTIGSTPAVQNAVVDAVAHLGVRHIDMPTTPDAGLARRSSRAARRGATDAGHHHGQRRSRAPTTSSRGCCSSHYLRDVLRAEGDQHRLRHHVVRRVHRARSTASR